MSPRGKDPENRDLPVNLSVTRKWFLYRRPTDGRKFSLGSDRARAIQTAKDLNAHYARTGGAFDKVTAGDPIPEDTFSTCVAEFANGLRERELAPSTLVEYRRMLARIGEHFEGQQVDAITTRDIVLFLKTHPPRASQMYRRLLVQVFNYVKGEGLRTSDNPATSTIRRRAKVQRERLTLEQYRLVYEQATPHIQNAMDLALHTLQRREDIAALRYADHRESCLWVQPLKTRKYGVSLKIEVPPELRAIIARCRDGVLTPFMVHQPYAANKARRGKRLQPSSLSRGFRCARERARALHPESFPVEPARRPSFHEIRGLGALLYKNAGRDPQALLGHLDPETTRLYLSRHEIQWVTVRAGLDLSGQ